MKLIKPLVGLNQCDMERYWLLKYKANLDMDFEQYRNDLGRLKDLRIINDRIIALYALEIRLRLNQILNKD